MSLAPSEVGRRIREVREQLGVTIGTLAALLGVPAGTHKRIEDGGFQSLPRDYAVIAARHLKTDVRYFISTELDDVEEATQRVFRALPHPTPADLVAIRRFTTFCLNEHDAEVLIEHRRPPLPPVYPRPGPHSQLHRQQGVQAAQIERRRLRLGTAPIVNAPQLLREQGVRLFRTTLTDSALSGVTILHPRAGVCVLVNFAEDLLRQFFSVAHEYAHVLFDRATIKEDGCVVSYRHRQEEPIEVRANAFASEFLLPTEAMQAYGKPSGTEQFNKAVRQIALDYGVNPSAVATRAVECKWISLADLREFKAKRPVVIGLREKDDPDMPQNLTERQRKRWSAVFSAGVSRYYVETLRRAVSSGAITFRYFAEKLDMTLEEAWAFVSATGLL